MNPDPATVKAHVEFLASVFQVSPSSVRNWIKVYATSATPSPAIVAYELRQHPNGRRRATLAAAAREITGCKHPLREGVIEGFKRD